MRVLSLNFCVSLSLMSRIKLGICRNLHQAATRRQINKPTMSSCVFLQVMILLGRLIGNYTKLGG